jgi:hypothetical protein
MRIHTTHTRDAALQQLNRVNRWLIAASVVLTGAFTEAAAHAFPGRTIKKSDAKGVRAKGGKQGTGAGHSSTGTKSTGAVPLKPPTQAPQAAEATSTTQAQEPAPEEEAQTSQQAASPEHEAAPAQEAQHSEEPASAPAEPVHESAPEPQPEPEAVVSGGS